MHAPALARRASLPLADHPPCGLRAQGVAIGLASIVGPVYIAESAPNSMRAMMVVMYAIEIGVGTVRMPASPRRMWRARAYSQRLGCD